MRQSVANQSDQGRALPTGDHGIARDNDIVAVVERKSLGDLVRRLIDGQFTYALADIAALPRAAVVVEEARKPAAVLVPIDEYEALEETAEILSDSATLSAIEAGLAELARGDSVTLDDLRHELAERRAAR